MRNAALVSLAALLVYAASPIQTNFDSKWVFPTALSIVRDGDVFLDEFEEVAETTPHGIHREDGRPISYFPISVAFFAVPVVAAGELVSTLASATGIETVSRKWRANTGLEGSLNLDFFDLPGRLLASLICAAAVFLLALFLQQQVGGAAAWIALVLVAAASPVWSMASRAMWQHGPAMLAVAGALFLVGRADPTRWQLFGAGILAGAAYTIRPTESLVVMALGLFVAWQFRTRGIAFAAGLGVLGLLWAGANFAVIGRPLPAYFEAGRLHFGGTFPEALAGNLVSPARGLLIYCPFVLLALFAPLAEAPAHVRRLALALSCAALALLVAVSAFPHWWAGHSFGPRFLTEAVPLLALPVALGLKFLLQSRWRRAAIPVIVFLSAVGLFIHARGATSTAVHDWNSYPVDVDKAPARIWDWRDPPFLRGIGR